jgi:UTP-glucose-1-phosphate uridylyltransferase
MKPSLLILAAGIGSRYGGIKQIDGFGPNDETILEYSIYDAIRAGFEKVNFIIRRDIEEDFKKAFADKFENKIEVSYVFQELTQVPQGINIPTDRKKPWGTGHAILAAAEAIDEPFAVLNADDFYGAQSFKIIYEFLNSLQKNDKNHYCIVGYLLANTLSDYGAVSRAICHTNQDGFLMNIVERTHIDKTNTGIAYKDEQEKLVKVDGDSLVSMNMMGFSTSIFDHLNSYFVEFLQEHSQDIKKEFLLPTVLDNLIRRNTAKIRILKTDAAWFGVTYPEDKEHVQKKLYNLVQSGIYPVKLV